jgi:hypothetical protein
MSYKTILLIILILFLGVFIYLKWEVGGDPNSRFNQTTRFALAKHPVIRTLLGLHNKGDARVEYLGGSGPFVIEWFQPVTENVDTAVIQQFADLAGKYTGRQNQVVFGGNISEGTIPLSSVENLALKAPNLPSGASVFYVIFATDYQPKDSAELSTTHGETMAVISLNANRQFLANNSQYLNNYLFSDMLHEFGNEIGLNEKTTDTSCIMDLHAGINGQPLENFGRTTPQDFCPVEQEQIKQLRLQY